MTEDIDVKITLIGTDNESEDLDYSVYESPEWGCEVSGNIATYSPASNDTGWVTFSYVVTDETDLESDAAVVSITIAAVNDADSE